MRIFLDTEFIEDGKTIDLISIGMVREDGLVLYIESGECKLQLANPWVRQKVLPHLIGDKSSRADIAQHILNFVGNEKPEFWAYYAAYDWVVLCQLFGTMMDLPQGWPMYCKDIKQLCDSIGNPQLPDMPEKAHNALEDAKWNKDSFIFLLQKGARP